MMITDEKEKNISVNELKDKWISEQIAKACDNFDHLRPYEKGFIEEMMETFDEGSKEIDLLKEKISTLEFSKLMVLNSSLINPFNLKLFMMINNLDSLVIDDVVGNFYPSDGFYRDLSDAININNRDSKYDLLMSFYNSISNNLYYLFHNGQMIPFFHFYLWWKNGRSKFLYSNSEFYRYSTQFVKLSNKKGIKALDDFITKVNGTTNEYIRSKLMDNIRFGVNSNPYLTDKLKFAIIGGEQSDCFAFHNDERTIGLVKISGINRYGAAFIDNILNHDYERFSSFEYDHDGNITIFNNDSSHYFTVPKNIWNDVKCIFSAIRTTDNEFISAIKFVGKFNDDGYSVIDTPLMVLLDDYVVIIAADGE